MLDTSPFFIVLPYKINFLDYQTKFEKTKAILLKRSFWRFYWCMKLRYILRSKKLDSFAKRSTAYPFLTFFLLTGSLHFISIFLWRSIKNRCNWRSFTRRIWIYDFHNLNRMKKFSKIQKTLKYMLFFGIFSKNGLLKKTSIFSSKILNKNIKADIFLLSSTSSIQPCRKRSKKKFAWFLHWAHLTKNSSD